MEQAVWVYFGVVTVILAFGIVGKLIIDYQHQQKERLLEPALQRLQGQCNFVCDSAIDTRLSADVELPSGVVITTVNSGVGGKICGDYGVTRRCLVCNCLLEDSLGGDFSLNLNTTTAFQTFSTHVYSCWFTRLGDGARIECQG